jgi:hypothetical protein
MYGFYTGRDIHYRLHYIKKLIFLLSNALHLIVVKSCNKNGQNLFYEYKIRPSYRLHCYQLL